jgi:hypothetical protein
MHTLVIEWPEMRDLQRAYFLSGIANLDVPQDHSFIASLYTEARKFGINDILSGGNMQTESILPQAWGYDASDAISLKAIHKKYGALKLNRYPVMSTWERYVFYPFIARVKKHNPLNYIQYSKDEAKAVLIEELGWRDYGGKHYESVFTKFFQAHYLPQKFGYDKRLAHLSSLIVSGQMTKEKAQRELQRPLYDPKELEEDKAFWIKKLGVSEDEYCRVMSAKPTSYKDFDNVEKFSKMVNYLLKKASIFKNSFRSI